jgi:hypothetical protein
MEDTFDEMAIDGQFKVQHLHRDQCPICRSGAIGMKFTRDFHTRPEIHARDLAVHFNMTEAEVMDHLNSHELVVSIETNEVTGALRKRVNSPDFYLDELSTLYTAMRDCFSWVTRDGEEYDVIKIDQMTKLNDAILKTITKMAELQGRLKGPGDANNKTINNKIEGDMTILIDTISGGVLCDRCQEKVDRRLQKMKLLE